MITPQTLAPKLAESIGIASPLYLKRDDLHPTGSHKGRSIPLMINKYYAEGIREFVISSSGNAALAAAHTVREHDDITLIIFVGDKINPEKLKLIKKEERENIIIKQVPNPKQEAMMAEKNSSKIKNLRQSTDDTALAGYESLARELAEIPNLAAVFIPTSSGTTAEGLHKGFQKLNMNPQIHIVQVPNCHPFIPNHTVSPSPSYSPPRAGGDNDSPSLATAIVDKVGHRARQIAGVLRDSNGAGWIAINDEIKEAIKLVKQNENIDVSPNGALGIAGLIKAVRAGRKFDGAIVCLVTGL